LNRTSQEEDVLGFSCSDKNGFCIKSFGVLDKAPEQSSGYVGAILKRATRLAPSASASTPTVIIDCDSSKFILQTQEDSNVCVVRKKQAEAPTVEEDAEPKE